jgi:hypothetical protein
MAVRRMIMKLPGFTAESSLCKTDELHHLLGGHCSTESNPQQVIPAQFSSIDHRYPVDCDSLSCYQLGGYFVCYCG